MDNKRIGVIGLGLMGTAMSERLLEHGFDVRAWNRTRDKADPLIALGARWSDNPLADARCKYLSRRGNRQRGKNEVD